MGAVEIEVHAKASTTWDRVDLEGHRASDAMAGVLHAAGVREIYGQSCPTALFMSAARLGIRQVGYRTENAGVAMADGAARVSRRVAVVTAQNGPAAGLLVAGLAEALKASTPVLAIVQEVPRATADRNAFQELDHAALFAGCTKWIRRIELASRAAEYTERAIRMATTGRPGPVVLLVSPDVLTEAVEPVDLPPVGAQDAFGTFPADRFVPARAQVAELAAALARAERPLLVAGGGIHHSGACEALARLQQTAGLPMATTNMGKGAIDENHPLSIGVVGNTMGTRAPTKYFRDYIESADLVILVGTRTNENGTASWSLFPRGAAFAQVDVDPAELGRNYAGLRLLGDARETIEALCEALPAGIADTASHRFEALAPAFDAARRRHRDELAPWARSARSPLRPERLMAALDALPGPVTWVADASYASIWLVQYLTCRSAGRRFITPRGIAGLGWGFPMAIGAAVAQPGSTVVCLTGDGGFAHCWAEMETARRHGVRVVVVVLNNGVLGFQINAEESRFGTHTEVCHFGPIDHVAIARACGCEGVQVASVGQLESALAKALASAVPFVVDVLTDPQAFPPLTAFESQLVPVVPA